MKRLATMRILLLGLLLPGTGCMLFNGPAENGSTFAIVRSANKEFQVPVESWWGLQRENIVMQRYDYSCGAAALATVVQYYWGDDISEQQILLAMFDRMTEAELQDRMANGLTMTDLRRAAVEAGYLSSMVRRNLAQLSEVRIPVVLRIEKDGYEHFVVYRGIVDDRVFLADPIRGHVRLSIHEFAQQWTDNTVLVVVKKNARPPVAPPLMMLPRSPVQHELQAARRFIQKNSEPSLANPLLVP
jgi:predicted double-glycine peptidase